MGLAWRVSFVLSCDRPQSARCRKKAGSVVRSELSPILFVRKTCMDIATSPSQPCGRLTPNTRCGWWLDIQHRSSIKRSKAQYASSRYFFCVGVAEAYPLFFFFAPTKVPSPKSFMCRREELHHFSLQLIRESHNTNSQDLRSSPIADVHYKLLFINKPPVDEHP